jgi:regulator of sirC expression with transglutaminase-like and TPR domain
MEFPVARQRFYHEVHQPEDHVGLARAALFVAQEEYPDLDPDEYLNALDTMAAEIEERLPPERYPLRVVRTINQYLYDELGFSGNVQEYYDPRNSYLNQVVERRTGIPITLSLVYLEIARRLDFAMVGIGMPGHFLIRPDHSDMQIFVDAFNQGEVLFEEDCQQRLNQLYGRDVPMRPEFFAAVSPHQFLVRMLTNLKMIYLNQGEWQKALAAIERILIVFPDAAGELRDRGLLYYQTGRWIEASDDLERYLDSTPLAEDADTVRQILQRMQKPNSEI